MSYSWHKIVPLVGHFFRVKQRDGLIMDECTVLALQGKTAFLSEKLHNIIVQNDIGMVFAKLGVAACCNRKSKWRRGVG